MENLLKSCFYYNASFVSNYRDSVYVGGGGDVE